MESWFSDIQEQAKSALEKTVTSIDKVLDIKEPVNLSTAATPKAKLSQHRQKAAERRAQTEVEVAASLSRTPSNPKAFSTPQPKEKKEESNFFDSFIGAVTETKKKVTRTPSNGARKAAEASNISETITTTSSISSSEVTATLSKLQAVGSEETDQAAEEEIQSNGDAAVSEPDATKHEEKVSVSDKEPSDKEAAPESKEELLSDIPTEVATEENSHPENVVAETTNNEVDNDDEDGDSKVDDTSGTRKESSDDTELEAETQEAANEGDDSVNDEDGLDSKEHGATDDHAIAMENPTIDVTVEGNDGTSENAAEDKASMAEKYAQKCATLSMTVQAREEQILELSHQINHQREENLRLEEEIGRFRNAEGETPKQQLDALTKEFTVRLGELQAKLKDSNNDRETLRKQLKEVTTRYESETLETETLTAQLVSEKDEEIQKLMKEGQKLSDKQVKSAQINKNLQAKIKDSDATIANLNARLQAADSRIQSLEADLEKRTSDELKYQQSALEVNAVAENQSKELRNTRDELHKLRDENSGMKSTLDKLYKQLSELERSKKESDTRAAEACTAAELTAQDKYHGEMTKLRQEHSEAQEQLRNQISDLQQGLARAEAQVLRKEENHKQELKDWESRLRDAEAHGQDLSVSISQATRPLLRQIENLQQASSAQVDAWEVAEAQLANQVEALQSACAAADEKAREAEAMAAKERVKSATLEEKFAASKRQSLRLTSDLEAATRSKEALSGEVAQLRASSDRVKENIAQKEQDFKQQRIHLQNQHAEELKNLKTEYNGALDKLQAELAQFKSEPLPNQPSLQKDRKEVPYLPQGTGNPATSVTVERLQNHLKLKEDEVASLRNQKDSLEKSRDAIAEELVTLVSQNESLSSKISGAEEMKQHAEEVEGRYNHLLQMYGEKVEEVQELRLDLQDVKDMMRTQTQQFVSQIEQLSGQSQ